jgi:hypothetical protein
MTRARDLASISPGVQTTFRNKIINGDMTISQRNIPSSTSASYTLDRWYASGFGQSGTISVTRSTATPPTNFIYFQRVAQASATTTNFFITQSLESDAVIPLQNKTVTLSFRYRNNVNTTNQWTVGIYHSTAIDAALIHPGVTRTTAGTKTLTNSSSWVSDSLTVSIPSNATSLAISFETVNSTVNGAQFDFTGVQLEEGSVATPFEQLPTGTELALCQRYYQNIVTPLGTTDFNFPVVRESTTVSVATAFLPVTLRGLPTLVGSSLGRMVFRDVNFNIGGVPGVTGITISGSGPSYSAITLIISHAAVGGAAMFSEWDVLGTITNLGFSAEL